MERMSAADFKTLSSKPQNKFRNEPVIIDGHRFASKAEGRRYSSLVLLQKGQQISGLELQPKFELKGANGTKVGRYTADFAYNLLGQGGAVLGRVVEDVKSKATASLADYKLRIALFKDNYPDLDFREVT